MIILACVLVSCGKDPIPKPRGYFRIDLPEQEYIISDGPCPMTMEISAASGILLREARQPGDCWFNIVYPTLKARVHCTYTPVKGNLPSLLRDANDFALKHEGKARAIERREYSHPEVGVHGLLFDIKGYVASPIQFYLTDSTQHFLRGALYFSSAPNPDSVAPVQEHIRQDILHLMETTTWRYE